MRSCSMALQLLSVAIGSYLSGALVYLVGLMHNSTEIQLSNNQSQSEEKQDKLVCLCLKQYVEFILNSI